MLSIVSSNTDLPRYSSEHEKQSGVDPDTGLCWVESTEPRDLKTGSVSIVLAGGVWRHGTAAVFRRL